MFAVHMNCVNLEFEKRRSNSNVTFVLFWAKRVLNIYGNQK